MAIAELTPQSWNRGRGTGISVSYNSRKDKGELIAVSSLVLTRVSNGASMVQRLEFPTAVSMATEMGNITVRHLECDKHDETI